MSVAMTTAKNACFFGRKAVYSHRSQSLGRSGEFGHLLGFGSGP